MGGLCFLAALSVVIWVPAGCTGTKKNACPSYSFNEPVILKFERGAVTLVAVVFIAAILWFVIISGKMPTGFSTTSMTFPDLVRESAASDEKLSQQMQTAQAEAAAAARVTALAIGKLEDRVGSLEAKR